MRLFVAIELPEDIKKILLDAQSKLDTSLAKLNPVKPAQMHLTLKFLGEVEEDKIDEIKNALKTVSFENFEAKLAQIGVFTEEFIKVIWVGLEPMDKLKDLYDKIDLSLKEFGFKDDFNYHPHLTLARVKFVKDKEAFLEKTKNIEIPQSSFKADKFYLIKSDLTEEGPVYEHIDILK
ncbi:RNA 2',3'-cyclic phosphodiesterase [Nanoarchaeota archaeon]